MRRVLWLTIFLSAACAAQPVIRKGIWNAELQLNDSIALPFHFEVREKSIFIRNADERLAVNEISYAGDSVIIRMPVFDAELRCRNYGDSMAGFFFNYARTAKNKIPFRTYSGKKERPVNSFELKNFSGRWDVTFASDEPPYNKAVGEFQQTGNRITGTFLTPTGDYRYLEGSADGDQMFLAAFDGSHLFYFTARMTSEDSLTGHFYSGSHWHDTWNAKRDEQAILPSPDSLTFLKPGYDKLTFSFPDRDSAIVSLADKKFRKKVVIVQLMGTWCPNCMDETAFLAPFYKAHKSRGLEVIALDYERINTFAQARKNIDRLRQRFGIEYPVLFAGTSDKAEASKTLPALNRIIAYPTLLVIDKKGNVRRIYTGFSGPGTGPHYEKWKSEFTAFIETLLAE